MAAFCDPFVAVRLALALFFSVVSRCVTMAVQRGYG